MIALPDEGDIADWVMCQPSGTVLYACQKAGTILGQRVLILGQGAIGQSFTAICSRLGARQVIAADLDDYRLAFSKRFGATHTINPSKEPLDDAVREITGGRMPDIVVEAAGYADTLNASIRLVKKFGKIVMFGVQAMGTDMKTTTPIDTRTLVYKEATVIPTAAGHSGDPVSHIETIVELRQRGWWDPAEMITHRMKFDEVQKVYDMYEQRTDRSLKVVMV